MKRIFTIILFVSTSLFAQVSNCQLGHWRTQLGERETTLVVSGFKQLSAPSDIMIWATAMAPSSLPPVITDDAQSYQLVIGSDADAIGSGALFLLPNAVYDGSDITIVWPKTALDLSAIICEIPNGMVVAGPAISIANQSNSLVSGVIAPHNFSGHNPQAEYIYCVEAGESDMPPFSPGANFYIPNNAVGPPLACQFSETWAQTGAHTTLMNWQGWAFHSSSVFVGVSNN